MEWTPASLPVFEIYAHEESGARIETHPWFYRGGRQSFGFTRRFPPHTGKGPAHVHTDIEQRSVVSHGVARCRVGEVTRELGPGEELVIPPGTPHVDPYNDTEDALELSSFFSPAPMYMFVYARTLGQAIRDGNVNEQQEFRPLHLMVMLNQPGATTFAAGPPIGLQRRVAIPLAAAIGRLLGYRPAFGFGSRELGGPRRLAPAEEAE